MAGQNYAQMIQNSSPVTGFLIAVVLPILGILVGGFILIKLIEVVPKLLNWFNRPKLRSEYEERRKSGMISCPSQLRDKDLYLDYDKSSLMQTYLGKIIGYSTIPSNTIILPDDKKAQANMPTNLRIIYYVPAQDALFYNISFGLLANLISDIIFTDDQTKAISKTGVILTGNSIEPMIGGGYHLLVSQNTPVYNIDNSLKMAQVTKLNSEFARTMKDMAENALRLNTAHTANLEREGTEAEVPVSSPLPSTQTQQKQVI